MQWPQTRSASPVAKVGESGSTIVVTTGAAVVVVVGVVGTEATNCSSSSSAIKRSAGRHSPKKVWTIDWLVLHCLTTSPNDPIRTCQWGQMPCLNSRGFSGSALVFLFLSLSFLLKVIGLPVATKTERRRAIAKRPNMARLGILFRNDKKNTQLEGLKM